MQGLLAWVFSPCVLGFRLYFFHNAFLMKSLQFCSKSELTTNGENLDIFCSFVLRFVVAIFAWIEISKKMSFLFRLPGHPVFSMKNLRCVPWICLYLSDTGFSDIVSWASSMQSNFSSYNCASFCFFSCNWWSKNFLMTSVNRLFFFQFFLPY